jgi:lactoylglutathione lyase
MNLCVKRPDKSMHIDHLAIWTYNLETMRHFYERYFAAQAGVKYVNAPKQFESYFLTFAGGARLELMSSAALQPGQTGEGAPQTGYAHLAMAVGSTTAVDTLTHQLRQDGFTIVDGPRWTGDGYYESVALDPDGNRVEITV